MQQGRHAEAADRSAPIHFASGEPMVLLHVTLYVLDLSVSFVKSPVTR